MGSWPGDGGRRAPQQTQSGFVVNKEQERVENKDVYRRHYRHVRELVPKGQRLEFRLREEWGPLCESLGKDVPVCELLASHGETIDGFGVSEGAECMLMMVC